VDTRVHCCLYFISPFGHGLKPLGRSASFSQSQSQIFGTNYRRGDKPRARYFEQIMGGETVEKDPRQAIGQRNRAWPIAFGALWSKPEVSPT